jgi:hypothetical protein
MTMGFFTRSVKRLFNALGTLADVVIGGSLYRYASRVMARGIYQIANAIAVVLNDYGYYRAARTVRHVAKYLVYLGRNIARLFDAYGYIDTVVDVVQEVDEVMIEDEAYTLAGNKHYYY